MKLVNRVATRSLVEGGFSSWEGGSTRTESACAMVFARERVERHGWRTDFLFVMPMFEANDIVVELAEHVAAERERGEGFFTHVESAE